MYVDRVDRVQQVLRPAALLEPKRELAHGDRDVEARQVLLREPDLLRELRVREYVVEKRLGPELENARHEFSLWVRVQCGEERVPSGDPEVVEVEAELGREIGKWALVAAVWRDALHRDSPK